MIAIILTIHTLIVLALIGVVLLQRSEGGALGMGGAGGGGGFMTGRGAATALTRTTSTLAAMFFATSILLALLANRGESDDLLIDQLTTGGRPAETTEAPGSLAPADLLRSLGAETPATAGTTPDEAPAGRAPEESAPPAEPEPQPE